MNYSLSKEESKRINILKTISIIFVVYIHAYAAEVTFAGELNSLGLPLWLKLLEDFVSNVISSFAVPMFFLLSSVLLFKSDRQYFPTIKNKVKTLVIPYLFWNTFGIMIFIVLQSLSFTAPFFSGASTPILKSSFSEWLALYGIGADCPKVYPLWFLRDLIVVSIMFPVIKMVADRLAIGALAIGVLLVLMPGILTFQSVLAWGLIGASIVKLELRMEKLDNIPLTLCVVIYLIASVLVLFTDIGVLDRFYLFIGVLFWIRMSKELYANSSISSWINKLTPWIFVIYAFHEPAMTALKKLCLKILPTTPGCLAIEYLVIPIVMIAGCTIFGCLFKKIMPKFYGIATGER